MKNDEKLVASEKKCIHYADSKDAFLGLRGLLVFGMDSQCNCGASGHHFYHWANSPPSVYCAPSGIWVGFIPGTKKEKRISRLPGV